MAVWACAPRRGWRRVVFPLHPAGSRYSRGGFLSGAAWDSCGQTSRGSGENLAAARGQARPPAVGGQRGSRLAVTAPSSRRPLARGRSSPDAVWRGAGAAPIVRGRTRRQEAPRRSAARRFASSAGRLRARRVAAAPATLRADGSVTPPGQLVATSPMRSPAAPVMIVDAPPLRNATRRVSVRVKAARVKAKPPPLDLCHDTYLSFACHVPIGFSTPSREYIAL
ncbi:uncharacterized protein Tco025E_08348 [Trypanosoma conorhini]|uniref:Uncharacterized protein n=1 Tax=Trypanosoma conorhini TaxID=83891 RepID=A0A3R7RH95_9TRYP|nr:uncharacterized protein Tco025E_08348 [Trypanosoma conorhini]RNF02677.1 hypothetical protein Tco025E_08348 [Trypanosoma conorhini]